MKKIIKIVLLVLIAGFIIIQFFRPDRSTTNDISENDITKKMNVPSNVQSILKRSCYDCHSNQTVWPWYSNIAPVSWLVADDVKEGRKKMNFSEWGKLTQARREVKLDKMCEMTTEGEMPLPKYLIIHKDAVMSKDDIKVICDWTKSQSENSSGDKK